MIYHFLYLILISLLVAPLSAVAIDIQNSYTTDQTPNSTKHIYIGDEMVANIDGTGQNAIIRYIHDDHLFGSQVATDKNGNLEELVDYLPYGKIRFDQSVASFKERRKFTGNELDKETNLTYAKARYYDGDLGRFYSIDPDLTSPNNSINLIYDLSNPQSLNSYSYALNNPLKYIDPDGRRVELVDRRVPSTLVGVHTFLLITPDNPNQIQISDLPNGTDRFTMGAYNYGGVFGIGNTLQKDIGFIGDPTPNQDLPFLNGEKSVIDKTLINPPNGQSDTEFINNIGKSFNKVETGMKYWALGQYGFSDHGNSNNFIYGLGSRAGIGDQIKDHRQNGFNWAPGSGKNLPNTGTLGQIDSKIQSIKTSVNNLYMKVKSKLK